MKVALVVPTNQYLYTNFAYLAPSDFPTGFAFLAAALKAAGHEVIGVNVNNDPSHPSKRHAVFHKLSELLMHNRPQLIGLGGLCTDYAFIKDALTFIRAVAPDIPIVCGGSIITYDARFIFEALRPDYCILGEAEEILVKLVSHLEVGAPAIRDIPNIGFWQDGKPEFTDESFSYPSLGTRAWPDYSPFEPEKMISCSTHAARNLYRYPRPEPRIMPFVAARNCPFNCTFCVHSHGPRYSTRPMDDIFSEIEHLYTTYRFNILIILDELFAIDKERLREFCNGILERQKTLNWDFHWLFQTHASVGLTLDDMKLMKRAGCYFFSYGIESASPRVLASMKKKINPTQIKEAIKLAHEAGIGFGGNFIFGDISETPETIIESMRFLTKECSDIVAHTANISPYPGSLLFEYCLQQGIIKNKLEYYETIDRAPYNMTTMPDKAWETWLQALLWPLNRSFPWAQSVEPREVVNEEEAEDFLYPTVRRIRAQCPHCLQEQFYREPIVDQAITDGTRIATGCPDCGKRFLIQLNPKGIYTGSRLGRQLSQSDLGQAIQNSIVPLAGVKEHYNVLLITPLFDKWQNDPLKTYLSGLGLEEGLAGNGYSVLSVPALSGVKAGDRSTWLSHLRKQCTGKSFDQIWIDLINIDLDDAILTYIKALAPICVGLINASLKFGELIFRTPPETKALQRLVDRRLRMMTHALVGDERDALWLNNNKKVKALWWLPAMPEHFIHTGSLNDHQESKLSACIINPEAPDLIQLPSRTKLDDELQLSNIYDQTNEQVIQLLTSQSDISDDLMSLHTDTLRELLRVAIQLRLSALSQHQCLVIAPEGGFTDMVRYLEGIASGRPVISTSTGLHPRADALFFSQEGIVQYSAENEGDLNTQLQRLENDPALAAQFAQAGISEIRQKHTDIQRIHQIMRWINDACEPDYMAPTQNIIAVTPLPTPEGEEKILTLMSFALEAFSRHDYDRAIIFLEKARRDQPSNTTITDLLADIQLVRDDKIRTYIETLWQQEHVKPLTL